LIEEDCECPNAINLKLAYISNPLEKTLRLDDAEARKKLLMPGSSRPVSVQGKISSSSSCPLPIAGLISETLSMT